jgi:hypothetical protein
MKPSQPFKPIPRDTLFWSPACVRFQDAKKGCLVDVFPRPSEVGARAWCASRGVVFVLVSQLAKVA